MTCAFVGVEVVARPVEVRGQQEDRVEAVLLAVGLRADEDRLLRHAVGRVRLLRVAIPEVLLVEGRGSELGIRADRPGDHDFPHAVQARLLEHVRAHEQVRVPVAARVGAVRADAAHLGREVEHHVRLALRERARHVVGAGQVEPGPRGHERLDAARGQPLDQVRADEPGPAGDEDAGARLERHRVVTGSVVGSQSTRPTHLSRLAAYQAIVRAMPSSHDTRGSQPVSRLSFS